METPCCLLHEIDFGSQNNNHHLQLGRETFIGAFTDNDQYFTPRAEGLQHGCVTEQEGYRRALLAGGHINTALALGCAVLAPCICAQA